MAYLGKVDVLDFFSSFFSVLFLHTSTQAGTSSNGQQQQQGWTGKSSSLISRSRTAAWQLLAVQAGRRERDGPSPEKTESTQCHLPYLSLSLAHFSAPVGPGHVIYRVSPYLCVTSPTHSVAHVLASRQHRIRNSLLILFLFPTQREEKV